MYWLIWTKEGDILQMKKYGFLVAEMLSLDTDSKGPLIIKVYISKGKFWAKSI